MSIGLLQLQPPQVLKQGTIFTFDKLFKPPDSLLQVLDLLGHVAEFNFRLVDVVNCFDHDVAFSDSSARVGVLAIEANETRVGLYSL